MKTAIPIIIIVCYTMHMIITLVVRVNPKIKHTLSVEISLFVFIKVLTFSDLLLKAQVHSLCICPHGPTFSTRSDSKECG
jgi:hypothetical protein